MSDHVGEAWRKGFKDWIAANLPAELEGFTAKESTEEGERPTTLIVVALNDVQRVPSMDSTGRVMGVIALREPFDDATLEEHRARAAVLWGLLQGIVPKPGPLSGVYLHDLRFDDRTSGVLDKDRVTGWPVSSMATTTVTE